MNPENLLEKFSYLFFGIGGAFFIYAVFRYISCPIGTGQDFCQLSGIALWSFYGVPAVILAFIAYTISKITRNKLALLITISLLAACSIRIGMVVLASP